MQGIGLQIPYDKGYEVGIGSQDTREKQNMITCDYRAVVVCSEIATVKNEAVLQAFGAHLRQLREQRGWSQQVLADVADVSKPTIYRIETARYSATLDVLASLAQGLGVSLGELVTFPPETTAASKTAISN